METVRPQSHHSPLNHQHLQTNKPPIPQVHSPTTDNKIKLTIIGGGHRGEKRFLKLVALDWIE